MGNLLGAPITEKESKGGNTTDGLPFGLSSMQGWRIHMEDAHICQTELFAEQDESSGESGENKKEMKRVLVENTSLFAVFDGHAGAFAAKFSEENFSKVLCREPQFVQYAEMMQSNPASNSNPALKESEIAARNRELLGLLEDALVNAFLEFDKILFNTILSTAVRDDALGEDDVTDTLTDDSGTTAVVVLLTPRWIICANAGDSRAIYSKSNGRAIPLSYDHKPDDEEEERRIIEAGGQVHGGRVDGDLAVSRGFGDFRFKLNETKDQVEQRVSPLPDIIVQNRDSTNDEFILLACDGVWDVVTNKECTNMVHDMFQEGETDMALSCEEVLDQCLAKGSKDNISCLIVQLPALTFGTGGGIQARRDKRVVAENTTPQQGNHQDTM